MPVLITGCEFAEQKMYNLWETEYRLSWSFWTSSAFLSGVSYGIHEKRVSDHAVCLSSKPYTNDVILLFSFVMGFRGLELQQSAAPRISTSNVPRSIVEAHDVGHQKRAAKENAGNLQEAKAVSSLWDYPDEYSETWILPNGYGRSPTCYFATGSASTSRASD